MSSAKYAECETSQLIAIARESVSQGKRLRGNAEPEPHDQPTAELLGALAERLEARHALALVYEQRIKRLSVYRTESHLEADELTALRWRCSLCKDTAITIEPENYPEGWRHSCEKDVCADCIAHLGAK